MKKITNELIQIFKNHLINEEKAVATIEKYIHDILVFMGWLSGAEVSKKVVLQYKSELEENYAQTSVNTILAALNSFFVFNEWYDCKVKSLKIQRSIFANKDKELSVEEYDRLLEVAKKKSNQRLYYVMQTICTSGIRVSELKFITVESVMKRQANIKCKGKRRTVILTDELCKFLKKYIKDNKIKSGPVFITKSGKPLDRSNIWSDLKKLCSEAGVSKEKVFPHNLRHLFARTYYSLQKDIVRLADILGHSNVNTTRIYTMESGEIHRQQLEKMGLLRC